jgi:hypothetical protein
MYGVTNWKPRLYFESEAEKLLKEYNQVVKHERNKWIDKKNSEIEEIKEEIKNYREFHSEFKYNCYDTAKKIVLEIKADDYEDGYPGLKSFNNFPKFIDSKIYY